LRTVSQDDDWAQFEIEGFRFFWPAGYSAKRLNWIYREVFAAVPSNPHAYEAGPVAIRAGEWVIDGGAGEGFFTAFALTRGASVLAVEPVSALCDALNRTFEREVRQGRVKVMRALLADRRGTRRISIDPESPCLTRAEVNGPEQVEAISIDEVASQGVIPSVGFIKMDIENAELEALRGSVKVMQASKPRLSVAVYHEVGNAATAKRMVHAARPDYRAVLRGAYDLDGCALRPYMLLAY